MSERSTAATRARRDAEVRHLMSGVISAYRKERAGLAERLNTDHAINPFALRPVLKVQADVIPWVRVQQLITKGTGAYPAMLEVREHCVRTLLNYGEAVSSDLLAMELDRGEREGMRRFLKATARFAPGSNPQLIALGESHEQPREPALRDVIGGIRRQADNLRLLGRDQRAIELFKMADEMERHAAVEVGTAGSTEDE